MPQGGSGEGATSLATLVPAAWREVLARAVEAESFRALEAFLDQEWGGATAIFPPREQVFAALAHTPPQEVRAVILGQDPYPTKGNANGLAFSVSDGIKVPASLKNLYTGLARDVGIAVPSTGNLEPWARRGVLLLNTVLTVREGEANSHRKKGWEPFTRAVVEAVDALEGPVIFFCFGNQARDLVTAAVRSPPHTIIVTPHPSPLTGGQFIKAVEERRPFSTANHVLQSAGRGAIDWSL